MNTDHVLYIAGEATIEENLHKVGIKRASNLIATLGTDADNVLLVLLAKGYQPWKYRTGDPGSHRVYLQPGRHVFVSGH
jgi:voltage-gated potassium channel Kch